MTPIEAALNDLRSQNPPQYDPTARKYGVDRSTLSHRHRGITGPKQNTRDSRSLLSIQQEKDLVNYINWLTIRGTPPTNSMVKTLAYDICKIRPGKNWVYRFVKHYGEILDSGFLEGIDFSRQKVDNYTQFSRYFELVSGPESFLFKANKYR